MIGYMIEQELGNLLPFERPFATLLTMIEVDPDDPAFQNPTKFIGPVYTKDEADRLAAEKQWVFKPDGDDWRRVVPSPEPKRIFELRPIKWLLEHNAIVIAAGGGGIPTMYEPGKDTEARRRRVRDRQGPRLRAARARPRRRSVRDADRRRRGLRRLGHSRRRRRSGARRPPRLSAMPFAAGSMGPKVDGGLPVRGGDREDGRDRRAGRSRAASSPARRARRCRAEPAVCGL